MYVRFVDSQSSTDEIITSAEEKEIEKRRKGFEELMSFAGTLPADFDYKKELEEARDEKYARFI